MREYDVDFNELFWDVPRVVSAYPYEFLSSVIPYPFHPLRNTNSAPMIQLNWSIPVYPNEGHNAMAFYARYFDEHVQNTSEIHKCYEWNNKNQADAVKQVEKHARGQPKLQYELEHVRLRYLPTVGNVILFSGAQLDEAVPNTTGSARYTIDFRMIQFDDAAAKSGARPSRVGVHRHEHAGLSVRGRSEVSMPKELGAMYDDGTATEGTILCVSDRLAKSANAKTIFICWAERPQLTVDFGHPHLNLEN